MMYDKPKMTGGLGAFMRNGMQQLQRARNAGGGMPRAQSVANPTQAMFKPAMGGSPVISPVPKPAPVEVSRPLAAPVMPAAPAPQPRPAPAPVNAASAPVAPARISSAAPAAPSLEAQMAQQSLERDMARQALARDMSQQAPVQQMTPQAAQMSQQLNQRTAMSSAPAAIQNPPSLNAAAALAADMRASGATPAPPQSDAQAIYNQQMANMQGRPQNTWQPDVLRNQLTQAQRALQNPDMPEASRAKLFAQVEMMRSNPQFEAINNEVTVALMPPDVRAQYLAMGGQ